MAKQDDLVLDVENPESGAQAPEIPDTLPMLPVRDVVVFPYMILPLFVGREKSVAAVDAALLGNRMLFLATQREVATEEPTLDEIYEIGTVAIVRPRVGL